ncbi:MAG: hypothetical protein ABR511_08815 [Acidimicrobiales bacterium]
MPSTPPPYRRRPQISNGATAIAVATGGVALGLLLFLAVLHLIGSGQARSRVGTDLYVLGQATPLAGAVARQGPLLLPDPLGRGRDVYVQHLGGGDWRTFDAHPPEAPATCVVTWRAARHAFVSGCSAATYPPDGTGLSSFPTKVDDKGRVLVDLRHPQPPPTAPASTTTTIAPPPS